MPAESHWISAADILSGRHVPAQLPARIRVEDRTAAERTGATSGMLYAGGMSADFSVLALCPLCRRPVRYFDVDPRGPLYAGAPGILGDANQEPRYVLMPCGCPGSDGWLGAFTNEVNKRTRGEPASALAEFNARAFANLPVLEQAWRSLFADLRTPPELTAPLVDYLTVVRSDRFYRAGGSLAAMPSLPRRLVPDIVAWAVRHGYALPLGATLAPANVADDVATAILNGYPVLQSDADDYSARYPLLRFGRSLDINAVNRTLGEARAQFSAEYQNRPIPDSEWLAHANQRTQRVTEQYERAARQDDATVAAELAISYAQLPRFVRSANNGQSVAAQAPPPPPLLPPPPLNTQRQQRRVLKLPED